MHHKSKGFKVRQFHLVAILGPVGVDACNVDVHQTSNHCLLIAAAVNVAVAGDSAADVAVAGAAANDVTIAGAAAAVVTIAGVAVLQRPLHLSLCIRELTKIVFSLVSALFSCKGNEREKKRRLITGCISPLFLRILFENGCA